MRKYSIIILFFSLPLSCLAQNEIATNINEGHMYKNQIDLEFDFLGFGVGYNKRVFKRWFVGVNSGIGFSLAYYHDMSTRHTNLPKNEGVLFEAFRGSLLLRHDGVKHLNVAFGFKYSSFAECLAYDCASSSVMGVGLNLFYGNRVQIGFKSMFGFYETNKTFDYRLPEEKIIHPVFSNSLLVLRVPVRW